MVLREFKNSKRPYASSEDLVKIFTAHMLSRKNEPMCCFLKAAAAQADICFYLPYFFGYKTEFFSFQNNPKDLDPSCKTDLDLWDCLGRVKLVL